MKSDGLQFLDAIQRCAEPEDAPRLIAACAGRVVFVPNSSDVRPDNWIAVAIGHERACRLIDRLQQEGFSDYFDVPISERSIMLSFRRALAVRIERAIRAGKMTHQIAVECRVSRRTVQSHRARLRKAERLTGPVSTGDAHG